MCKLAFKELAIELVMEMLLEAKNNGFDYQDMANYVDCSPISVQKYYYGEKTPSLPVFIALWKRVKPVSILKRLAGYSGHAIIKLPEVSVNFKNISLQTSKVMKETADVISAVAGAIENEFEKKDIAAEINEAIEALLKLRAYMED